MIGLFDSGIGGLTVVRELLRQSPDASFIYLGDTARTPYGNKSKETIERYALEDAKFLVDRGATSIVIACNSASAAATDALRLAYPSIPIFEVITPAVDDAVAVTKGRVGVIGTRATIASGVYQEKLIAHGSLVIEVQACPLLVPLVEEGWLEDDETKRIVKHYLSPVRSQNVDTLILGCTHYPLLAPIIQRYMGNKTTLIDSAASVVRRVLENQNCHSPVQPGNLQMKVPRSSRGTTSQEYYLTDLSSRSTEIARQWLGRSITFTCP